MNTRTILSILLVVCLVVASSAAGGKKGEKAEKPAAEAAKPATPAAAPAKAAAAAPAHENPQPSPKPEPAPQPSAAPAPKPEPAPAKAPVVVPAQPQAAAEPVAAGRKPEQITLTASLSTTFLTAPFGVGVKLNRKVAEGETLVLTATGSDGIAQVNRTFSGDVDTDSFVFSPLVGLNGNYEVTFTASGSAAAEYLVPCPLTFPTISKAKVLYLTRPFNYIHTGRSMTMRIFLGVPVPALGALATSMNVIITDKAGFNHTIALGRNEYEATFTYTAPLDAVAENTLSVVIPGVYGEYYEAPDPFNFVVIDRSPVTLLNTLTVLQVGQIVPLSVLLGTPIDQIDGSNNLKVTIESSNGYSREIVFAEGESYKPVVFNAGQNPGIFTVYIVLSGADAEHYQAPPPFPIVVLSGTPVYQVSVASEPTALIQGTEFPMTINLHHEVPAGHELHVICQTSDTEVGSKNVTFAAGESSKTVHFVPHGLGVFTVKFLVEGSANALYLPPPFTAASVLPALPIITYNAQTEILIGSAVNITINLGVPVPTGSITLTLQGSHNLFGSVTLYEGQTTGNLIFPAGSVLGTYVAHHYIAGESAHLYVIPPDYGFTVVGGN